MGKKEFWHPGDSPLEEISLCGRFILFHLFSGGAQLIDIGTQAIPRRLKKFDSAKGAKIAAKRWLAVEKQTQP